MSRSFLVQWNGADVDDRQFAPPRRLVFKEKTDARHLAALGVLLIRRSWQVSSLGDPNITFMQFGSECLFGGVTLQELRSAEPCWAYHTERQ